MGTPAAEDTSTVSATSNQPHYTTVHHPSPHSTPDTCLQSQPTNRHHSSYKFDIVCSDQLLSFEITHIPNPLTIQSTRKGLIYCTVVCGIYCKLQMRGFIIVPYCTDKKQTDKKSERFHLSVPFVAQRNDVVEMRLKIMSNNTEMKYEVYILVYRVY